MVAVSSALTLSNWCGCTTHAVCAIMCPMCPDAKAKPLRRCITIIHLMQLLHCLQWYLGAEAERKVDALDDATVQAELQKRGVTLTGNTSVTSMKEALKSMYVGKDMTTRQVFDSLDVDQSGFLDRQEVERA